MCRKCSKQCKNWILVQNKCLEESENLLSVWIEDMKQKQVPLSLALIWAKTKKKYNLSDSLFNFQQVKVVLKISNIDSLHNIFADHVSAKKFLDKLA